MVAVPFLLAMASTIEILTSFYRVSQMLPNLVNARWLELTGGFDAIRNGEIFL